MAALFFKVAAHTHQVYNITQERNTEESSRKQNSYLRIEYLMYGGSYNSVFKRQNNFSYLLA